LKKTITYLILFLFAFLNVLFTPSVTQALTFLKVGSTGEEVKTVQTQLTALGYNPGITDGIFGAKTKIAVQSFQSEFGLISDGVVGPITRDALARAFTANVRKVKTNGILATANSLIGTPYLWGGSTPAGFDCSGFVQYVFARNGITLPRISREQYTVGTPIEFSALQPGDLVFFSLNNDGVVSHDGIYIGNNQFINSSSSKGVTIYTMGTYWKSVYVGAKRVY
jgi:peptidoglycan DL-endopeptidase CwlO